jgi:hypothetical protein
VSSRPHDRRTGWFVDCRCWCIAGFTDAYIAAGVLAVAFGVVAYLRMPAARMDGAAGMHMLH